MLGVMRNDAVEARSEASHEQQAEDSEEWRVGEVPLTLPSEVEQDRDQERVTVKRVAALRVEARLRV